MGRWCAQQNAVSRWLRPNYFLHSSTHTFQETISYRRRRIDSLEENVSERMVDLTIQDRQKYQHGPERLNYVPSEFKKGKFVFIKQEAQIPCGSCSRRGNISCKKCRSTGELPCSRFEQCSRCHGRGCVDERCWSCHGSGSRFQPPRRREHGDDGRCWTCHGKCTTEERCSNCGGDGALICGRCGGDGSITCDRCRGAGTLQCKRCNGAGILIRAIVATKKFVPRRSTQFVNLDNGHIGLRNGLKSQHFRSLSGKDCNVENGHPRTGNVVLQKSTEDDFYVSCHQFEYENKRFFVNEIIEEQGKSVLAGSNRLPVCPNKVGKLLVVVVTALIISTATVLGLSSLV